MAGKRKRPPTSREQALTELSVPTADQTSLPDDYGQLLDEIKQRIAASRVKAALAVNRELIALYWDIGRLIVQRQQREGWGTGVIERLGRDIQAAFPGISGFSPSNLGRMRSSYLAYQPGLTISAQAVRKLPPHGNRGVEPTQLPIPAQAVRELPEAGLPPLLAEIPWGHNVILLEKLSDSTERLWYAQKTTEHGWSRPVLVHQIESGLYRRQGQAEFSRPEGAKQISATATQSR